MTCIVGLEANGKVIIGGDSAGIADYDLTVRRDPKVFRNGPFLIGYTDSFRMGQLLRFRLHVEKQHPDVDDFEFMATVFIDAVRSCLGTHGFRKRENDVESGGTFLVGYRGILYRIGADFQIGVSAHGFDAVGCGASAALGALAATDGNDDLFERVRQALTIAERFSAGVRGPFVIDAL